MYEQLITIQQCDPHCIALQVALAAKMASGTLGLHDKVCSQQARGSDFSPLVGTGEATAGVLGPALGSPVQERYRSTAERSR